MGDRELTRRNRRLLIFLVGIMLGLMALAVAWVLHFGSM